MTATFVSLSLRRPKCSLSLFGAILYVTSAKRLEFWNPSLFNVPILQPISTLLGYPLSHPYRDIICAWPLSPSAASTSNTEWCALLIYAL